MTSFINEKFVVRSLVVFLASHLISIGLSNGVN